METPRNEYLWRKAKQRAGFKIHLRSYLIVNAGLWLIYFLSMGNHSLRHFYPWPIWPMLGWGIGLASHYFTAYGNLDEKALAEREYEKLVKEQR
ncbi:2TM domain-containing protein [Dyadobacter psychrotolerans]|uniref:2TM domain-containing protein n=1 Tax=Dyadobacter psychrotolerans TaxID=2541721 RepID=A0A4R5E0V4_9BACT|nr:2TM domain-containing protein [Dyadobacter psychrotolerans]TDE18570.1 2TM domain-containing protein [Dyadobacter psychrotolerans]